jgi:hypothetical protein
VEARIGTEQKSSSGKGRIFELNIVEEVRKALPQSADCNH